MPSLEEHMAESIKLFGKPFVEVHKWLDRFAGTPEYGMRHRHKCHHAAGVEEVRRLFGSEAAEAARQHILSDLKQEGWTESDRFPKDEKDYKKLGLFF